jgi:hypothetical protein
MFGIRVYAVHEIYTPPEHTPDTEAARVADAMIEAEISQRARSGTDRTDKSLPPGREISKRAGWGTDKTDTSLRVVEQGRPRSPLEVQQALGLTGTPRHMMNRMAQAGLLRRVATGGYVVAEERA